MKVWLANFPVYVNFVVNKKPPEFSEGFEIQEFESRVTSLRRRA